MKRLKGIGALGAVVVGAALAAAACGSSTPPPPSPSPSATATPTPPTLTPTATPTLAGLPSGTYTDGPEGTPHYFIVLAHSATDGLSGTVGFLGQDGNTSAAFAFTGAIQSGVGILSTSTGRLVAATFGPNQIDLGSCTEYLEFAQANADCSFTLSPNGIVGPSA